MNSLTIRYVIVGAAISVIGIVFTQIYWVKKAFTLEEEQFQQGVKTALFNTAKSLTTYNQSVMPNMNPVKEINSNYYIVNVNDDIDANLLEHFLKEEFSKRNIHTDFDYAIYDCSTDEMVYGDYISLKPDVSPPDNQNLQKYDEFNYYFGVRFPQHTAYIASKMGIWIFSSFLLLVILVFFASTIFIILRQKRLSEVQKDFINNMTHEFKTPLSTIGISADVLMSNEIGSQPDRLKKYAQIIKSEASRLNNQVLRVLQMARMEKENEKLKIKQIDLKPFLEEIVHNLSEKISSLNGQVNLHDFENIQVKADEVHLSNIINNLLENAMLYCKSQPDIEIHLKHLKTGHQLTIQDHGIGIAKEHQKKVFDKFFRVPKGNVHDVKGFGLGLDYVKKMITAHRWKISLESKLNEGTSIHILIPNQDGN